MADFSVDPNISRAKTIHTDLYTSSEVFDQCKEKIFTSSWQFVGSTNLVQKPEDVNPLTLLPGFLDEPLLLTKDQQGKLHLLSNVCTHRGNLIAEKACHISRLRCRYHGRTFGLDGKFRSMPEFKEVENFPSPDDDLTELPLFQWGNWLFSSLDKKYEPEVFFGEMMQRIEWMPIHDFVFRPELTREFHVKGNWALYCENYLEGFHIPFVHAGLNAVIDYEAYSTELFSFSNLQMGLAEDGHICFDLPASSPDYGKQVAAYYFWVFPNMMFNFYPWGLSVNIVNPISVEACKVTFLSYVWDDSKRSKGAGSELDKVEMEDEEIVENVQRGVRSRFYKHGRYSANMEKGTHHFHRILAEWLKN